MMYIASMVEPYPNAVYRFYLLALWLCIASMVANLSLNTVYGLYGVRPYN